MKRLNLTTLILCFLVPAQCFEARVQDKRTLSYEPAIVELYGKLTVELKYGPPNYGEQPKTDARLRVPVLILNEPINVRAKPGDGFNANAAKKVRRIQLIFNPENPYKEFIGKKVSVEGTLFHSFSGHHYTKVVMDVRSISHAGAQQQSVGGRVGGYRSAQIESESKEEPRTRNRNRTGAGSRSERENVRFERLPRRIPIFDRAGFRAASLPAFSTILDR